MNGYCSFTVSRMLFGERPYWWIAESRLFINNQPNIHQFSSTCETGPGEKPLKQRKKHISDVDVESGL